MKRPLLNYLRCPHCHCAFELVVLEDREDHIYEGLLRCQAGQHLYPIVRSIPRILCTAFDQEADFRKRHKTVLAECGVALTSEPSTLSDDNTARVFGHQWMTFDVQRPQEDEAYFRAKTGLDPASMRAKVVLDAGCGGGRYTRVAAEAGATVISVDISKAVEKTASLAFHLPNVHIIQADIFALPFASATFDFVYSIGVLHHTPNTKQALDNLIPLVKEDGEIAIWLYPRWPAPVEAYNKSLRAITTRMSLDTLHRIAVMLEPIGLLKLRLLSSERWWTRVLGQLLRGFTIGVSYHPDREVRICDTFDWFSPPYQWHHTDAEVESWLREYGLCEIRNLSIEQRLYQYNYGNGINFRARRPVAQKKRDV